MVEWVSFVCVCVCVWQSYKSQTLLFFRVFVATAKEMSVLLCFRNEMGSFDASGDSAGSADVFGWHLKPD